MHHCSISLLKSLDSRCCCIMSLFPGFLDVPFSSKTPDLPSVFVVSIGGETGGSPQKGIGRAEAVGGGGMLDCSALAQTHRGAELTGGHVQLPCFLSKGKKNKTLL